MKAKILIALFCSFGLLSMAQSNFTAYGKKIVVGIVVGPSFDWMSAKNENVNKKGVVMGVRCGIPLDINLTADENYYISTGIMFNYTGGKHVISSNILDNTILDTYEVTRKYRASYVTLVSGVKLKTPSFSNCVIVGNAGLYHSFFLSGSVTDSYNFLKVETTEKTTKYKGAAFFRESVYAGLGFEYIIKDNLKVNMFVNYTYTFTNFFNKNAVIRGNERMKGNLNGVEILFGFFF